MAAGLLQEAEASIRDQMLRALDKQPEVAADCEAAPPDFQGRLALFAKLEHWRRDLEEALKLCKDEAAKLEGPLLEDMALNGIESTRVDGLTLYRRVIRYVSKKGGIDEQQACDTLRACGFGDLIKDGYAPASLKARVCEMLDEKIELPGPLVEMLNVGESIKLASRK